MINRGSIKNEARKLRKAGLTFRDIAIKLKLPLSTIHLWTKDVKLTRKQLESIQQKHKQAFDKGRKIGQQRKHEQYTKQQQKYYAEGYRGLKTLSDGEMMAIGTALYWGEGFKKDSRFGFANSDPQMITLILNWLYRYMNVSKEDVRLRLGIHISFQEQADDIQKRWAIITKISLSQFQKPFFQKTEQTRQYKNANNYLGVLRIRVNNHPELLPKITGMIAKVSTLIE